MINQRRRSKKWLILLVVLALAGLIWLKKERGAAPEPNVSQNSNQPAEERQPELPLIDLQPTVDGWADGVNGQASVVVVDLANNKTVASLNPDRVYFAASIYKLYVAYEGYQKVAEGTYSMDETYLGSYSRGKCLDEMIRSSYSPCGEKMWDELGKDMLTKALKNKYGLKNTNMTALQTSAADAAVILQRLFERRDLTEEHKNLYLDSLKTQPEKYRRGLPMGFINSTVYNKVGWNEDLEWHDTAIVTLPNGRSYVVSVLTRSIGGSKVRELGKLIEAKLNQ